MLFPILRRVRALFRRSRFWSFFLVTLLSFVLSFPLHAPFGMVQAETSTIRTPLSTQGARIIDATGKSVLLRGVNWFGIETDQRVPHGLWSRDYKDMLAQIRKLGYNIIRLPYSVQSLRASTISGVNFELGSNRDLRGKTPLQAMDLIIQEAERQGLLILLDSHRLNDSSIPELWYGDGFSEMDWIETWKNLATRYQNQSNVIGADLKNEPHGRASWGTGDATTDWRLAAERAGNEILSVNPNWLIVVEGVEQNVPGQKLSGHWWGANLEGVKNYPVRLSRPNKLVYSPHEYGPGVYNQPWFSEESFPRNLYDRWEIGFHYIATQGIAPIFVGEFGGKQVDFSSKEGIWQRQFVDYLRKQNLSFTYWSWNPNSGDTGGILQDDWQSIHQDKQDLLSPLLTGGYATAATSPGNSGIFRPKPGNNSATRPPSGGIFKPRSKPTGRVTRSPSGTPEIFKRKPSTPGELKVESSLQSDWQTGFCQSFKVSHSSGAPVENWKLQFQMKDATITNSWNGQYDRQGSQYTVTPPDWGRVVRSGQTVDLGFCANKTGSDYKPTQIMVTR